MNAGVVIEGSVTTAEDLLDKSTIGLYVQLSMSIDRVMVKSQSIEISSFRTTVKKYINTYYTAMGSRAQEPYPIYGAVNTKGL